MARRNWDKAANELFDHLPKDYQDDWADLRDITQHQH